ncbi:MAG: helix-hairpin-helix domain-containing protein [Chloroflexi bacterium]|nr:helix-hairpin-helix domain-containing protein [Chloroflexota bacterium]
MAGRVKRRHWACGLLWVGLLCGACASWQAHSIAPIEIVAPTATASPTAAPIVVHVVGAVNRPGVYTLAAQSRVVDAVNAAGGLAPGADTERINLADFLRDGQQIYVPFAGTQPPPSPTPLSAPRDGAAGSIRPVNINTASAAELEALPGIGPTYASRIIAYRQAHGPFKTTEEIMQVQGIGPACYEKIAPYITVQ